MLKRLLFFVAITMITALVIQCKHDTDFTGFPENPDPPVPSENCSPDSVYFVNSVLPLIKSSCGMAGCHDMETAEHGIILTEYYRIKITGEIKPGNSGGSKLYRVLSKSGESKMPPSPNAELSSEQKAIIAKWIDQGAKNNYCSEACNPESYLFSTDILPTILTNCRGCHSGNQPSGGIRLEDYNTVKTAADNGSLYGTVAQLSGYSFMPKDGYKLSDCKINQIQNWIDNGALNN